MTRRRFLGLVSLAALAAFLSSANAEMPDGNSLRPFVRGSFAEILEAGKGRPLIVNFWSLGCLPCLAEMPLLNSLVKKRNNVRLAMVSTDTKDDIRRIRRTLAKYELTDIESWVFAETFVERLRFDVDRKWRGELPRTYLVGVDGSIETISGALQEAAVEKWLERQNR